MNPNRLALNRYAQREMERQIDAHGIPLPNLRAQREATDMTQVEFAALIGYTRRVVGGVEVGLQHPTARFRQAVTDLLHIRLPADTVRPRMGDQDMERDYIGALTLCAASGRHLRMCVPGAVAYNRHGWPWRYSSKAPETLISKRGVRVS